MSADLTWEKLFLLAEKNPPIEKDYEDPSSFQWLEMDRTFKPILNLCKGLEKRGMKLHWLSETSSSCEDSLEKRVLKEREATDHSTWTVLEDLSPLPF